MFKWGPVRGQAVWPQHVTVQCRSTGYRLAKQSARGIFLCGIFAVTLTCTCSSRVFHLLNIALESARPANNMKSVKTQNTAESSDCSH